LIAQYCERFSPRPPRRPEEKAAIEGGLHAGQTKFVDPVQPRNSGYYAARP
jgi:hypothetical protein